MGRDILDSNKLIRQWQRHGKHPTALLTEADVRGWADELIRLYGTNSILTPIYLEVVGGASTAHEMTLTRAFLARFDIADEGRILPRDWEKARNLAERIPRGGSRRGAVDCLIRAISIRLNFGIITNDLGMPRP